MGKKLALTLYAGLACLSFADTGLAGSTSDLTFELGGTLLEHGGVVTVYSLPVDDDVWSGMPGADQPKTLTIDSRYTEIQLRYPRSGTFTYRFRPVAGSLSADKHATQVLSVIGTDMEDRGPQMQVGFAQAHSSGGRVIRIPSMAELAGPSDADRTAARWGQTEGSDALPPADERSARALEGLLNLTQERFALQCRGDDRVQACAPASEEWTSINALWWRALAEQRLERLRDRALRRCYDSSWFGGGTCTADPESDEPTYIYRN